MMVDGLQTLARKAHAKREPQLSPPSHGTPLEKILARLKGPVLQAVRSAEIDFGEAADREFISSRVTCSRNELDIALRNLVYLDYLRQDDAGSYRLAVRGISACTNSHERRAA